MLMLLDDPGTIRLPLKVQVKVMLMLLDYPGTIRLPLKARVGSGTPSDGTGSLFVDNAM